MKKVITYGTYDLLHYGHIRLLERAKALGDYLIVGVTSDDYDKSRGKINVSQTLTERLEAVRALGIADEIIVEEYEGQKIDDIRKYEVDIFTVGSDWEGVFDYLKPYCEVVYLQRTEGVSSSELRAKENDLRIGLVGDSINTRKVERESAYVNGLTVSGMVLSDGPEYDALLRDSDAVYLHALPEEHDALIRKALLSGTHVLVESPVSLSVSSYRELTALAEERKLILMEALKTAYSTAYQRLVLLLKGGKIGDVVSVDATCTSMSDPILPDTDLSKRWGSITDWGPTALLPVFQILGTEYVSRDILTRRIDDRTKFDIFTNIHFTYPHAAANIKVGTGVKSEGELIISGTRGYIYVPAPWWKTDFFEVRYENQSENRRYFYQLEGEGIRYELAAFLHAARQKKKAAEIEPAVSEAITELMEAYYADDRVFTLS